MILCLIFQLLFTAVLTTDAQAVSSAKSKVIYINSYHRGYSWSDNIEKGLRSTLEQPSNNIELSIEFLDEKRFPDLKHLNIIAQTMKVKYFEYKADLIIVSDNAAFDFVMKYRKELFPNIPVVFCGYNLFTADVLTRHKNITGVNEELSIPAAVKMAIATHPKTNTLAFVTSTRSKSNSRMNKVAEEVIFPELRKNYNIVVLKNKFLADMEEQLKQLPSDTIVFLMGQVSDKGDGRNLSPSENAKLISEISPFPIYTFWNFHLNQGVLGGHIITGYEQGKTAAKLALRVLSGTPIDQIPVVMTSPAVNIFDYNVMQRFDIDIKNLPLGSKVINKPITVWDEHKKEILISLIILISQTILIIFLFKNIKGRKEALLSLSKEKDLLNIRVKERTADIQKLQARYKLLSELSFDAIFLSQKGQIKDTNKSAQMMFGYSKEELLDKPILNLVTEDSKDIVALNLKKSIPEPYEIQCLKKDGQTICIEIRAKNIDLDGETYRVSVLRDISRLKNLEEQRLQQEKRLSNELKVTAMSEMLSDIAHHWRQPLGVISATVSYITLSIELNEKITDEQLIEYSENVMKNVMYLSNNIDDFTRFFHSNNEKLESFNIKECIIQSKELFCERIKENNIKFVFDLLDCEIKYIKTLFSQLLLNFHNNTFDAIVSNEIDNNSRYIFVTLHKTDEEIQLIIKDSANGVKEEIIDKIFDPYFTTKHKSTGTGNGLYMAHQIITKHLLGEIEVHNVKYEYDNKQLEGAEFVITIPQ